MKRIIIIVTTLTFLIGIAPLKAIEKIPKKSNKSSVVQKKDSADQKRFPTRQKEQSKKRIKKDTFIDRDGDGINDSVTRSKPPAIKKPVIKSKPKSKQVKPHQSKPPVKAPKPEKKPEPEKKSKSKR